MIADDCAVRLAAAASNIEGLSTFEQIIARAEALKAARRDIFTPLHIDVLYEAEPEPLTEDEMKAVLRQFYGELQPDEMQGIVEQYKAEHLAIEKAFATEEYNARLKREGKERQRASRGIAVAVAV